MKTRWLAVAVLLAATAVGQTSGAGAVPLTQEPSHHLALENSYVRAFKVEVAPHAATLMHQHDNDYIFVTLGKSHVENDVQGKAAVELKLADGETRLTPGHFSHIARNLADTPFRNVTVEILHPKPTPQSAEKRGVSVLEGGLQDVLFVKEGVTATDTQLHAGAMLPKHSHSGPHLVIAVTDLDLRGQADGKPATEAHLKAGDIAWMPGGVTHTVMNIGKQQARWITLEFEP